MTLITPTITVRLLLNTLITACLLCPLFGIAKCQPLQAPYTERPLNIAIRFLPPFAFETNAVTDENGGWDGIAIELWQSIAECLQTPYVFKEYIDDTTLIEAMQKGQVDIALGAFVANASNEEKIDFTHSYFQGHIGLLVTDESGWASLYRLIQNFPVIEASFILSALLLMMITTALLYWQAEQKKCNPLFTDGPLKGFYNAMIWSTVLVFSGQGSPFEVKHRGGQVLVILLMFFGVSIVSIITALLTSSLTLQGLGSQVTSIDELAEKKIAYLNTLDSSMKGITINDWLTKNDMPNRTELFSWVQVMLSLQQGQLDALVHSKEQMQYLIKSGYLKDVKVLPLNLERTHYSLILADNSPLTETLNRQILEIIHSDDWQRRLEKYIDN